jgi:hypothetical protein
LIYITGISMSPKDSQQHEHITHVYWSEYGTSSEAWWTKQQAVDWINGGGDARVSAGGRYDVKVHVVNASPPYLRTAANGTYTDNLLSLPRF